MILKQYSNPKGTGWLGWIENQRGRVLAFIRLTGEIVWDW